MSTIKSFSDLKNKASSLETLQKSIESKTKKSGGQKDTRFWIPSKDKTGNGSAVIRFLPPSQGEEIFYTELKSHAFQGPGGGWFIENCPTTIGLECPVCESNRALWATKDQTQIDIARIRKAKTHFVTNIYVVKDPANPENEGKVFLYKFGVKIFEKIKASLFPEYDDETPVVVYDFWEGANFKLRISNVGGYVNYDKSSFDAPSKFLADDTEIENVWNQQFKLGEFTNPDNFKPYKELKQRFDTVTKSLGEAQADNLQDQLGKTVFPATGEPLVDDDLAEQLGLSISDTISGLGDSASLGSDELDDLQSLLK